MKIRITICSVMCFASMLLSSCAGTQQSKVTTTTENLDGSVTVVTSEPVIDEEEGFFESKNLKNYLEFESKRIDKFAEVVDKKIDFIKEQSIERQPYLKTDTERVLSNVVDTLLVDRISNTPPPSNVPVPKTMADSFGNLTDWGRLALQGAEIFLRWDMSKDQETGDGNTKITNDGGIVINNSSDIFKMDTSGESSGSWDLDLSKYFPTTNTNTNTNTYSGDYKSDSSLF